MSLRKIVSTTEVGGATDGVYTAQFVPVTKGKVGNGTGIVVERKHYGAEGRRKQCEFL